LSVILEYCGSGSKPIAPLQEQLLLLLGCQQCIYQGLQQSQQLQHAPLTAAAAGGLHQRSSCYSYSDGLAMIATTQQSNVCSGVGCCRQVSSTLLCNPNFSLLTSPPLLPYTCSTLIQPTPHCPFTVCVLCFCCSHRCQPRYLMILT
jgi:hypothetical protein